MIDKYVSGLAKQKGIKLANVSITGGPAVACVDYRLEISSKSHLVHIMIHQSELDSIENDSCSGFLELKIGAALDRLNMQLVEHHRLRHQ